jgi:sialic acid synthase SpsE
MSFACDLIDLARKNGADMVKFQLFDTEKIDYWPTPEIKQEAKDTEVTFDQARNLYQYGEETGIEVFFSVFDTERVQWCEDIGVKRYKISCSMRTNGNLIGAIVKTGKPIIITLPAVITKSPMTTLYTANRQSEKHHGLLPVYGVSISDCHFKDIVFGRDYDGFSDHSIGLDASKIAIARGAKVIEKHFSIDHETGMDAKWSMNPEELRELRRWADLAQSYRRD